MKRAAGVLFAVCILPAWIYAQAAAYDYSMLYEKASPAVVQVITDDGSGSGFLVTPFGHIATNYHVIRNSRYLAVQFPGGRKVIAAVAATNARYDMAVLKVNSGVVDGIQPLALLPGDKDGTVKVGIPVVAIGSPLNQRFLMTQGILSKVDEATVLGDFLLQAGNSGGPLMNCDGEVLAINTFGEGKIGGAIRIDALRQFLSSPELLLQSVAIEPPADQLPSISSVRYPIEALNQKIETEAFDPSSYRIVAGDFSVTVITPVLIAKIQIMQQRQRAINRLERRGGQVSGAVLGLDDAYFEWHRSTETSLDYVVTFNIRPETGPTKDSAKWRFVPSLLRFGKARRTEMEFKGEFLDFRIYRDGELLQPIMPGRQVVDGDSDKKNQRFVDQAYAGMYMYSPDDFLGGKEFRLQIIDARHPNEVHKELVLTAESKLIKQLRADFTLQPAAVAATAP
jgi:hypothetical protein